MNTLVRAAALTNYAEVARELGLDPREMLRKQGSFTRRSLVVKRLTIQSPSLNTHRAFTLTEPAEKPATQGFFGRFARWLAALLLF